MRRKTSTVLAVLAGAIALAAGLTPLFAGGGREPAGRTPVPAVTVEKSQAFLAFSFSSWGGHLSA